MAYAAPIVAGSTNNKAASSSSLTLTKPSSVAVGDLLIIIVGNDDDTDTAQWDDSTLKPTGFTLINEAGDHFSDCHTAAFWRVADGTEGATVGVNSQAAANNWGIYYRITGAQTTSPIDATGADFLQTTGTTAAVTALTTTVEKALIFCAGSTDGLLVPVDSIAGNDWVVDYEVQSTAVGGIVALAKQRWAGASDLCTFDWSGGSSNGFAGFQFAIAPRALTRQLDLGAIQTTRPDIGALQSVPGGGVTIEPTGIASSAVIGTPSLIVELHPNGVGSASAIGTPALTVELHPTGVPSTAAIGTPSLVVELHPTGVPSAAAIGTPSLTTILEPIGVASTGTIGIPSLELIETITAVGVASTGTIGVPSLTTVLEPTGSAPTGTIGVPSLTVGLRPSGVSSTGTVGVPILSLIETIYPTGTASTGVVGIPSLTITVVPEGVPSTGAIGVPTVDVSAVYPVGLGSTGTIGLPTVGFVSATLGEILLRRPPERYLKDPFHKDIKERFFAIDRTLSVTLPITGRVGDMVIIGPYGPYLLPKGADDDILTMVNGYPVWKQPS